MKIVEVFFPNKLDDFGDITRIAREMSYDPEKGACISQEAVATLMGVSTPTYQAIEYNNASVKMGTLLKAWAALGLEVRISVTINRNNNVLEQTKRKGKKKGV